MTHSICRTNVIPGNEKIFINLPIYRTVVANKILIIMGSKCSSLTKSCRGKSTEPSRDEMLMRPTQHDIASFLVKVSSLEFIRRIVKSKSNTDHIRVVFQRLVWDVEQMTLGSTLILQEICTIELTPPEQQTLREHLVKYQPQFNDYISQDDLGNYRELFLQYVEGYVMLKTLIAKQGRWWVKYRTQSPESTLEDEVQLYINAFLGAQQKTLKKSFKEDYQQANYDLAVQIASGYLGELYNDNIPILVSQYLSDLYDKACHQ